MFSYKTIVIAGLLFVMTDNSVIAQTVEYTRPSWWFGGVAAANLNFYGGSTQKLNATLEPPVTFNNGFGVGLFGGGLIEYYRPNSHWGFMLQGGYDSRSASFATQTSPCNCPADLTTKLSYLSIEPSLRYAPFKSGLYLFAGPRFAFNMSKSFTYSLGIDPSNPEQIPNPDVKGDFSDVNASLISVQIGAGYDIQLSGTDHKTQWVLSPFVSFHPYFGQEPRSVETWTVSTVRVGAALKFGQGRVKKDDANVEPLVSPVVAVTPVAALVGATFKVNSPENNPVKRNVKETYPLRNYVYFDEGSTKIAKRYELIKKKDVPSFSEDNLESSTPKTSAGRTDQEMLVYYNILNILGDRMLKNPNATITLVGSSQQGAEDGKAMAESVKTYLTDVWGINPSRITSKGENSPKPTANQDGSNSDVILLREDNRKVAIQSNSPALLMEFQSGTATPSETGQAVPQEAPPGSYVSIHADGGDKAFTSWSLLVTDDKGAKQNFGPYTKKEVSIPGKAIMGNKASGTYKVEMTGNRADDSKVIKDTTVHIVQWTPPVYEEAMRYSILYEFDKSKALPMYSKYLTETVVPRIPKGATILIYGHTDVIGEDDYNSTLSTARSNDVKGIMERALAKAGRKDVKFEVSGLGEDQGRSPFKNSTPEGRAYNRTVIIDIIPVK